MSAFTSEQLGELKKLIKDSVLETLSSASRNADTLDGTAIVGERERLAKAVEKAKPGEFLWLARAIRGQEPLFSESGRLLL